MAGNVLISCARNGPGIDGPGRGIWSSRGGSMSLCNTAWMNSQLPLPSKPACTSSSQMAHRMYGNGSLPSLSNLFPAIMRKFFRWSIHMSAPPSSPARGTQMS